MLADVFQVDEIALQEAFWEQQQIDVLRSRSARKRFHARECGLDIAKNLWRLACPYSQMGSQIGLAILARRSLADIVVIQFAGFHGRAIQAPFLR